MKKFELQSITSKGEKITVGAKAVWTTESKSKAIRQMSESSSLNYQFARACRYYRRVGRWPSGFRLVEVPYQQPEI